MRRQHAGSATLGLAACLLFCTWALSPPNSLPIYDGLGLPPEPYRYLQPPPGQPQRKPPTSSHLSVSASETRLIDEFLNTRERPAQASVEIPHNSLQLIPRLTRVTMAIRAVPPPAGTDKRSIDGNAYLVSVVGNSGTPLAMKPNMPASIYMRSPSKRKAEIIERYTGTQWTPLRSTSSRSGDFVSADVTNFGTFAIVVHQHAAGGANGASGSRKILVLLLTAGLILGLLIVALLLIRLSRGRAPPHDGVRAVSD